MDNEVKTGELSVSLKTRPRNGSYCDYVTESSQHSLKRTRPNRNSAGTQAGKFQAIQVKKKIPNTGSHRGQSCVGFLLTSILLYRVNIKKLLDFK